MSDENNIEKLEKSERRIELLKYLHGTKRSIGDLAEHFGKSDKTLRTDISALRDGWKFLSTKIRIESSQRGSQKHYYISTVHPVFLPLNATELFCLLKVLEKEMQEDDSEVYRHLFDLVYAQMTDYAENLIADKLEHRYEKKQAINQLEEESFNKGTNFYHYWQKRGDYILVKHMVRGKAVENEYRLNRILKSHLLLEDRNNKQVKVHKDDCIIDWKKASYI